MEKNGYKNISLYISIIIVILVLGFVCFKLFFNKASDFLLENDSIELKVGETYDLNVAYTGKNSANEKVLYFSDNIDVVKVDEKTGKINALKPGNAKITITIESDYSVNTTCYVTVLEHNKNNVNDKVISINIGQTEEIKLDDFGDDITYESSDNSIAVVDDNGKITAIGEGEVTITAKSNNKETKFVVSVGNKNEDVSENNINIEIEKISFEQSSVSLFIGDSIVLKPTMAPSTATNNGLIWSSSNSNIAVVDQNGEVKGVGVGNTVISVTSSNGNKSAQVSVEVKQVISDIISNSDNNNNNNSNSNSNSNNNNNSNNSTEINDNKEIVKVTSHAITSNDFLKTSGIRFVKVGNGDAVF